MADFGRDLSCVEDLDLMMTEVEGSIVLGQDLARRLSTPRGALLEDPNYGRDLRQYLSRGMTPEELAALPDEIRGEVQKDERVEEAEVEIARSNANAFEVRVRGTASEGPFSFTFEAAAAAVTLTGGS
jgi:hypothetical protein